MYDDLALMEVVILLGELDPQSLPLTIVRCCSISPQTSSERQVGLITRDRLEMCRYAAQNAHIIVIQVDFRLGPEHPTPAQVEDCTAAYKWVGFGYPVFLSSDLPELLFNREAERVGSVTAMPPNSMGIQTIFFPLVRLLEAVLHSP